MIRYIKCPRCDLNYIDADKQEYCDVCISEMKGKRLLFDDIDLDDEIEELEIESELCPICGTNYIRPGESMCESCKSSGDYDTETEVDPETDDVWKAYLDDETEDDIEIDEEEEEEEEEDPDEFYAGDDGEVDDFDESLEAYDDDDFDDEDDDDDDDDDDLL